MVIRSRAVSSAITSDPVRSESDVKSSATPSSTAKKTYSIARIAVCWLAHLYTATGVLVNFFSLLHAFIITPDFHLFAQLNWLAIFIDATDGTFARAVDVKAVVPNYDGALLDNIIDFMTFSMLPALAIVRFELVDTIWLQYMLASFVLIGSAYAFCQTVAKTSEAFVGFPSYWNIVVFYLYYLETRSSVAAVTIFLCAILSFVPIHFIYPTRTRAYMRVTLVGAYIWGSLMLFPCIMPNHAAVKTVLNVSLIYVVYYIGMSLYLDYIRRKTSA